MIIRLSCPGFRTLAARKNCPSTERFDPRASRHYLPGQLWHITHRCHEKSFLLEFPRDRCCYLRWLFEAKKRQLGITVLYRGIDEANGTYALREARSADAASFDAKTDALGPENTLS